MSCLGWYELQVLAALRFGRLQFQPQRPPLLPFPPTYQGGQLQFQPQRPPQFPPTYQGGQLQFQPQRLPQFPPTYQAGQQESVIAQAVPFYSSMASNPKGAKYNPVFSPDAPQAGFRMSSFVQSLSQNFNSKAAREQSGPIGRKNNLAWTNVKPPIKDDDRKERSMEFTVMSYNILSQRLMGYHPELYEFCDEADFDWRIRSNAINLFIKAHEPDIMCLQEMEENFWHSIFLPLFHSYGYTGVFQKRTGSKSDGCAILFKHSMFALIKCVPVDYCKGGGCLDRDNVGLIVLLRPNRKYYKGDVERICVTTTHLLFNPKRGDIKLAQLILLLAEMDKHASFRRKASSASQSDSSSNSNNANKKIPTSDMEKRSEDSHSYCPTILCGDFNAEPFSQLYQFITEGHIHYEGCISRLFAGQKEGQQSKAFNSVIPRALFPKKLKITERCRYSSSRQPLPRCEENDKSGHNVTHSNPLPPAPGISQYSNSGSTSHYHEEQASGHGNDSTHRPTPSLRLPTDAINTGHAYHSFEFKSAYDHVVTEEKGGKWEEVSTYHSYACCTCDFIFYSSENYPHETAERKDDTHYNKDGKEHQNKESAMKEGKGQNSVDELTKRQRKRKSRRSRSRSSKSQENDTSFESEPKMPFDIDFKSATSDVQAPKGESLESKESANCNDSSASEQLPKSSSFPKRLELVSRYDLPTTKNIHEMRLMPNAEQPSDHLCLLTKFILW